ncbi:efflux RND transporter periplasmic adaptor subunit [Prosthecobacter sp.]|jgi:multidrug efflux system membrane fusion protein|uniref:efflux RND transporter periplasmic adaptor subunit n=1 Tax=Prosthecobacter sp. TaxID=1965333 RepID=UPI00378391F6
MARTLRALLPLLILAACGWGMWWLVTHKPEMAVMETRPVLVTVEGMTLKKTSYPVRVSSQGAVQPRTQSTLVPEVAGMIVEVSPSFRPGGFFEKGELLVKLDAVDYETAVVVAKAAVALAKVTLAEEEAKAEQALENWKALGRQGAPGELVSRAPQVARAKADLAAAEARVVKAERDSQRTIIRAPYAGQVLEQVADVGQYVSPGTTLGRIFATDFVEVRLPLPERESMHVRLPEHYRDASESPPATKVRLRTTAAGKTVIWEGRLVRVESALDAETRQSTAVAQIDNPFSKRADGAPPLKIGQFIEAEIEGDALEDVFIIPRAAVRAGDEIILITAQKTLRRMFVEPIFGTEKQIVVSAKSPKAPKEGDVLCLTPIPFPADGARVNAVIDGLPPAEKMADQKKPEKKAAMVVPEAKPLP